MEAQHSMTTTQLSQEGTIPFNIPDASSDCYTWYKTIGDVSKTIPIIMVHGGPGAGHSDLLVLASLEQRGIPVIYYDQVGCGRSSRVREKAHDASFWTIELFCSELDNLIDHFELRNRGFFLHGHSWGGMLASVYAGRRPCGLRRLIIANSSANSALYTSEATRLFRELPVSESVIHMDADEKFDEPEYRAACETFLKRHFCRIEPWPEVLQKTAKCFDECTMFNLMWGRSRLRMTGTLKNYDAMDTASNIDVPTLLVTGRYDYMTKAVMEPWSKAIPEVEWVIMEESSHMGHLEETGKYLGILERFLLSS